MSQTKFWINKPALELKNKPNRFVVKCYKLINNKKYTTLLDLGCGRSRDAIYFAGKGLNVTAVDVSKNRIQALNNEIKKQKISNINYLTKNIADLNFPSDSFDLIYAHLSLHYFDSATTAKIFKDLYKITKRKGMLFIKVKSIDDPKFGRGAKIGQNIFNYQGHIRHFFSKSYLQHLLKGWDQVNIRRNTSVYLGDKQKSKYLEAVAIK